MTIHYVIKLMFAKQVIYCNSNLNIRYARGWSFSHRHTPKHCFSPDMTRPTLFQHAKCEKILWKSMLIKSNSLPYLECLFRMCFMWSKKASTRCRVIYNLSLIWLHNDKLSVSVIFDFRIGMITLKFAFTKVKVHTVKYSRVYKID